MRLWVFLLVLFCGTLVHAADRAEALAIEGVKEFNAAYHAWDAARFAAAADLFRQAIAQAPDRAAYQYWLGAAQFHRVLRSRSLPSGVGEKETDAWLEEAVEALSRAVKIDERHAESHALLGTIYGMRIEGSLFRVLQLGPRIQKHGKQALEHGATDPRVHYLLGTCHFHTAKKPAAYEEALASFLAAEKLFEQETGVPAGPLEPRWGRGSCLTFIGRTYENLGKRPEAADYFRRALELHPADHYAREGLARVGESK
jgi:tetratricopeptide (TPR) repeat protein